MKKVLLFALSLVATVGIIFSGQSAAFAITADNDISSYLVDFDTGTVLSENKATERKPIASMVKIMTLLLAWEAVDSGKITLDQQVVVSDSAAAMGGSQMFLESGDVYSVDQLLKGITVVSANDASVQIAELLSGNVSSFVAEMNAKAAELGMVDTLFSNCTGLPDSGEQYSTAKDVSIMFRELVKHDGYFAYSKVYMEDFNHPDGRVTEFVNTNKLVRFYKDCDGGKTGFTNEAMFCLSATAKRDGMRVVATVVGAPDSKTRFKEVTALFNYAFSNYTVATIVDNQPIENNIVVENGKSETISVAPRDKITVLCDKNKRDGLRVEIDMEQQLYAPIAVGQVVGSIKVLDADGNVVGQTDLVSLSEIAANTYWDALLKTLRNWKIMSA